MYIKLFLICFLINFCFLNCYDIFKRVKLKDVKILTLERYQVTIGRKPIFQLQCFGNELLCIDYAPKTVKCFNKGHFNFNIKWECEADLNKKVQFENLIVSCEGYDHPNDPYIIDGSCGLKYSLNKISCDEFFFTGRIIILFIFLILVSLSVIILSYKNIKKLQERKTFGKKPSPQFPPPDFDDRQNSQQVFWTQRDICSVMKPEYKPFSYHNTNPFLKKEQLNQHYVAKGFSNI